MVAEPSVMCSTNPVHLHGPATTGITLAAAFIHAEFHEELGHIRHAACFIHDDESTGTHDGAQPCKAFVVDGNIEEFGWNATAAGSSRLSGLESTSARDAAADVEDDFPKSDPDGDLNQACVHNLSGQGKDLGTLALLGAETGVPLAPLLMIMAMLPKVPHC